MKFKFYKYRISLMTLRLILCYLFLSACVSGPPVETGDFRKSDLVELIRLDSAIHLDIRYATAKNFAGRAVYSEARAFLQRPAALQLVKVNRELRPLGLGLLVFDGYRPWSVTKLFWDITPEAEKKFVADPGKGSKHNRGCAIDCSLYEIASGKEVPMPGEYDESSERSYADFKGGTAVQREMRDLLRSRMEAHGFSVYAYEWWHFDYMDWQKYRIENIPFEEIKPAGAQVN
jgi:zinc D-Ala-D-Ala dipeptidase